jgi:hypothetical protein
MKYPNNPAPNVDHQFKFYECGICSYYHSALWDGDCREDAARFTVEQLDEKFSCWLEVEMPL